MRLTTSLHAESLAGSATTITTSTKTRMPRERPRRSFGSWLTVSHPAWMFLLLAGILVLPMTGCTHSLEERNSLLIEEVDGLRSQLVDRNLALDELQSQLQASEMNLSTAQQREAQLQSQLAARANTVATPERQLRPDDAFGGIPGVESRYSSGGEVTAVVEGDILFDSGKTTLKGGSKSSLASVARVLQDRYNGRTIRVTGYTDSDPIRKSGFKSNHHLGFERAWAVREYLISRGISDDRIVVASHGPNVPMSTKKESRRVEISVYGG